MRDANCDKPTAAIENETSNKCKRKFREGFFDYDGNHILGKGHNNDGHLITKYNWTNKDDVCVGPVWNMVAHPNRQLMSMNLFLNCNGEPCDGKIPCIR